MPQTVDLTAAPPPQATCYVCDQSVALDRRARSRGRFRCPVCRADNLVDQTGVGRPLRGEAERLEHMPLTRCHACSAVNRLPKPILARGSYRCHECRALQPVPRTLRKRFGPQALWLRIALVVLPLLAITVAGDLLVGQVRGFLGSVREGLTQAEVQETMESLKMSEPSARQTLAGTNFRIPCTIRNHIERVATLHVRVEVLDGETPILQQVVSLVAVPPGAERSFEFVLVDPSRRRADRVGVHLVGVS